MKTFTIIFASLAMLWLASAASAQSSSLYKEDVPVVDKASPLRVQNGSWTFAPPPPVQEVRINDLVYIRVNVGSEVLSEGDSQARKTSLPSAARRKARSRRATA